LLALRIREIGKIVSGYDTGIGGTPTVDVHLGDSGSIAWESLTDKHDGTKPLTLTLSQRERGYRMAPPPRGGEEIERWAWA